MSKSVVTRLFLAAVLALVVGLIVSLIAVIAALAGGAITIGGESLVEVDGAALAGTLTWLVIGSVAITAGSVAAIASWIGALLNTAQLEDKTWFIVLLVLGVFSFGWVAMAAYVLAGPDATRSGEAPRGVATTPSA